jgi:cellulose synthase/poly-beta-1,6-N-acetylglucosamine synthase-like glycosyltransferase
MSPRPRSIVATGLLGIAAVGPIAYPAWLGIVTHRRRDPEPPEVVDWPAITVMVCAYREREIIAAKVDDLRANGYPGALRILVVADDPDTARAAKEAGADVIAPLKRLGKAGAINRGMADSATDVVVLSDANAMLTPGALTALVRWFADPSVGAAAGEKQVGSSEQGAYWRFESWLKRREWRRGSTIGLVGELAAVRRSLFRPLPADVSVDDLWLAIDVLDQGARIAYEPTALACEPPSPTWAVEWERRTRVSCGALDVLWRCRRHLRVSAPGAPELWGHRLVRTGHGPPAHPLLLLLAAGSLRDSALARVFLVIHLGMATAVGRSLAGAHLTTAERVAAQVAFLQLAALGGLRRFLAGDRPALWRKGERDAAGF